MTTQSLKEIKGEFNKEDLMHLLRRCLFGVGHKELDFFNTLTKDKCLAVLLKQSPLPEMLAQEDPDLIDPLVPNGMQWVNAPFENDVIDKHRTIYLKGWWTGQIINRDFSLTEKMILFWHNHFVTQSDIVKDSRYSFQYAMLLRKHAIGNFKDLILEGTTNPAMLVYLNGNTNSKEAPNENYARELLELFTIGKDRGATYTEEDVKAAAKVLSGWKDNKQLIRSEFDPLLHDTSDKKFSPFFNNCLIKGKKGRDGAKEIDELIEMIFRKKETAEFFCRNLYRWLVSSNIDDGVEEHIIAPLAKLLIASNFEVAPVLRTLLSSEHFFDKAFRGCIVKSPVDFLIGLSKQFNIAPPMLASDNHLCWIHYSFDLGGLSMMIGDPPSVAGWPAYHQANKYDAWWINSYTLGFRKKIIKALFSDEGMECNVPRIKIDPLTFIKRFDNPGNLDSLVDNCVTFLLAVEISEASKNKLKEMLFLNNASGKNWTDIWNDYISDPAKAENRALVEARLNLFFIRLTSLAEFQVM